MPRSVDSKIPHGTAPILTTKSRPPDAPESTSTVASEPTSDFRAGTPARQHNREENTPRTGLEQPGTRNQVASGSLQARPPQAPSPSADFLEAHENYRGADLYWAGFSGLTRVLTALRQGDESARGVATQALEPWLDAYAKAGILVDAVAFAAFFGREDVDVKEKAEVAWLLAQHGVYPELGAHSAAARVNLQSFLKYGMGSTVSDIGERISTSMRFVYLDEKIAGDLRTATADLLTRLVNETKSEEAGHAIYAALFELSRFSPSHAAFARRLVEQGCEREEPAAYAQRARLRDMEGASELALQDLRVALEGERALDYMMEAPDSLVERLNAQDLRRLFEDSGENDVRGSARRLAALLDKHPSLYGRLLAALRDLSEGSEFPEDAQGWLYALRFVVATNPHLRANLNDFDDLAPAALDSHLDLEDTPLAWMSLLNYGGLSTTSADDKRRIADYLPDEDLAQIRFMDNDLFRDILHVVRALPKEVQDARFASLQSHLDDSTYLRTRDQVADRRSLFTVELPPPRGAIEGPPVVAKQPLLRTYGARSSHIEAQLKNLHKKVAGQNALLPDVSQRDVDSFFAEHASTFAVLVELMRPEGEGEFPEDAAFKLLHHLCRGQPGPLYRFLDMWNPLKANTLACLRDVYLGQKRLDLEKWRTLLETTMSCASIGAEELLVERLGELSTMSSTAKHASLDEAIQRSQQVLMQALAVYFDVTFDGEDNVQTTSVSPSDYQSLLLGRSALSMGYGSIEYPAIFDALMAAELTGRSEILDQLFDERAKPRSPLLGELNAHNREVMHALDSLGVNTAALVATSPLSKEVVIEGGEIAATHPRHFADVAAAELRRALTLVNERHGAESTAAQAWGSALHGLVRQTGVANVNRLVQGDTPRDDNLKGRYTSTKFRDASQALMRASETLDASGPPGSERAAEVVGHALNALRAIPEAIKRTSKTERKVRPAQTFTIGLWDRREIAHCLNLGKYVSCCLAPDGSQFQAMLERFIDLSCLVAEVRDETGQTVSLAWLFLGETPEFETPSSRPAWAFDEDDAAEGPRRAHLVVNFLEMHPSVAQDANLRKAIIKELLEFVRIDLATHLNVEEVLGRALEYGVIPDDEAYEPYPLVDAEVEKVGPKFRDGTYYLAAEEEDEFYQLSIGTAGEGAS